jgi:hypothetical protein
MINWNGILTLTLVCGLFFVICGSTFALGLRLIRRSGFHGTFAFLSIALLLGIIVFEFALIGMVADPRAIVSGWKFILTTAAYSGLAAFVAVIVITLAYLLIFKGVRWIHGILAGLFKNTKINH